MTAVRRYLDRERLESNRERVARTLGASSSSAAPAVGEKRGYIPKGYCVKIKGPDNPTSQLLPIMSIKGCSRDGEGRKGKGGGEGSRS